jgi:hypothetical protein
VTATSMDPFSAFHVHSYYTRISTCKERLDMDVLREGLRSRGDNDDPIGLATRTTLPLCLAGDGVTLPILHHTRCCNAPATLRGACLISLLWHCKRYNFLAGDCSGDLQLPMTEFLRAIHHFVAEET